MAYKGQKSKIPTTDDEVLQTLQAMDIFHSTQMSLWGLYQIFRKQDPTLNVQDAWFKLLNYWIAIKEG